MNRFLLCGSSSAVPLPSGISANYLVRRIGLWGVFFLLANLAQAGSATWDLNPASDDWSTAANWTPMTVPNGPADTATFALSNTTTVSNSKNTIVDGITFAPGASSFTITASSDLTLTLNGVGISNDSGTAQNFVAAPSGVANAIRLFFKNSATAGSGTFFIMKGAATLDGSPGWILFDDSSSASHGTFTNNGPTVQGAFGGGATIFNKSATASSGTFINNGGTISSQFGGDQGLTNFNETSTAANGVFINNAATVSGAHGGTTAFDGNATAANGTFLNKGAIVGGAGNGFDSGSGMTRFFAASTADNATFTNDAATVSGSGGGFTEFRDASTAGNGIFTNKGGTVSGAGGGLTYFYDKSTAGNATLVANGGTGGSLGGTIIFKDNSTGGTSRVEVFGNGNLDISFHDAPSQKLPGVAIGSIEGNGNVFLGANNLTVGSNNMSTTFSGGIQDVGGQNNNTGGSLTKIGAATLDLTGANTYTGNTNVNGGVLKINGSITSNTFVNHSGTLAGIGTINGTLINNHATVSPGDATGTLTVNNYAQPIIGSGKLLIDIAGASDSQFSILNVLGNANVNGFLAPVLLNGFIPSIGDEFTFLNYGSLSGAFRIQNSGIFNNGTERWVVTYHVNDAVLTATKNVPDRGSTLVLLLFGLLGPVAYRQQLLRKQS